MPHQVLVPEDGLPMPLRVWAIMALAMGTSLAVIVTGTANIALPSIAQDFNITPAESVWVINVYQLLVTMLLLPLAALGGKIGYRKVYLAGLIVFAIGSLACGLSNTFAELITARAVQGVGGAGLMSVGAAITRIVYPSRLFGRGISIAAMVVAISATSGPAIAAVVLSIADWRWLYFMLLPCTALSFVIGWRVLPGNTLSQESFDYKGAILNALTLGFFILAIGGIGHQQAYSEVAIELILSIVIGIVFIRHQMRQSNPLLPLNLLKIPVLSLSLVASFTSFCAQAIALVTLPFYLQSEFALTPAEVGFQVAAWPFAILVLSPIVGFLADRYPAGLLGTIGLCFATIGLIKITTLSAGVHAFEISWPLAFIGAGYAFFQQPNVRLILSAPPKDQSGSASALLSTTRLTGQTTGAATAAIVFAVVNTGAYNQALNVAAMMMLCASLVSAARMLPMVKLAYKEH